MTNIRSNKCFSIPLTNLYIKICVKSKLKSSKQALESSLKVKKAIKGCLLREAGHAG